MTRLMRTGCVLLMLTASNALAQSFDWTRQIGTAGNERFQDIAAFGGDFYAAGYTDGALNGDPQWQLRSPNTSTSLRGVEFVNGQVGVAVGFGGVIMRTADGGVTWQQAPQVTGENLFDVRFLDALTGFAVGTSGTILRTVDGGLNWGIVNTGPPFALIALDYIDASTWLAVGSGGTIIRSTDGGTNWGAVASGTTVGLNGIHVVSPTNIIVTGDQGLIIRSTDGGLGWAGGGSPTAPILRGVHFADASNGIIVGDAGAVRTTVDGGVTWTPRVSGTANALLQVFMTSALEATAVGVNGTILHTVDGGVTWTPQASPTPSGLNDVYFTAPNTAVAVGDAVAATRSHGVGGGRDVILARFDSAGNEIWVRQFGSTSDDEASGIHVDATGVYIVGETRGALPGWAASGGTSDGFIRRYDLAGTEDWTRQFGNGGTTVHTDVAGDGVNIFTAGASTLAFPQQLFPGSFVRQYSIDGTPGWREQFGADPSDQASSVHVDANGVYVAGWTWGTLPGQTSQGGRDAFIRRYTAGGVANLTVQFGTTGPDWVASVRTDPAGEVYVCGNTGGALPGQTFGGLRDIFVRRYTPAGGEVWTDQIALVTPSSAGKMDVDDTGVYLTGAVGDALPGQSFAGGSFDGFVRKYSRAGNVLWTNQFGTAGNDGPLALVADGAGGGFVSAWSDTALFPPGTQGAEDIALARVVTDCPAGARLYVDAGSAGGDGSSWAQAFAGLSEALDVAATCPGVTEIWVAAGTYYPTLGTDRGSSFEVPAGVAVYGGFAGGEAQLSERNYDFLSGFNVTVLSGDINAPFVTSDNSYHVVTLPGGGGVVLDGLQISDGNADGPGDGINGGGINNIAGGAHTFSNLYIAYNSASNLGGGAMNGGASSWTNCRFEGNTSGNDGGGLFQGNNNDVPVVDCVFYQNTGLHGGAIRSGGAGPYVNVVFDGNHATNHGGALENFGSATFLNVTFVNNTCQNDGPAIHTGDLQTPDIVNAIFWNNTSISNPTGPVISVLPGANHVISYSLVEGSNGSGPGWSDILGTDGGGNIDLDPQFDGTEGFENRLTELSPAVDAGNSGAAGLPATDLDGNPRISGAAVDMGAYEFVVPDSDGDGIPDALDACPFEDATFFDRDNDGCIDAGAGGRHVEYRGEADSSFTWVLHDAGAPGVGQAATLAAVQAAFASWDAVPGKLQSATYGGTTAEAVAVAFDGVNHVTFSDTEFSFGSSTLAVGLTYSFTVDSLYNATDYRAGQIVESDMIFNPNKVFSVGGVDNDIESVAAHEIGHWWGISHSARQTSTMFYVLPPGANAAILSEEDKLAFRKAYPDASTLASNRIEGFVADGLDGTPVPGAIVFLTSMATGDTVGCEYTLPIDGRYSFMGMPDGDYYVSIHPINGTAPIGYLIPERVNELIAATAQTVFVPEYYNDAEGPVEPDPLARTAISVSGGSVSSGVNLFTNIDVTPPLVVSTDPADGALDVPADGAIRVRFSEPINTSTLVGNFLLTNLTTLVGVSGTAVFLDDDSLIAFTPGAPLDYSTQYQLELRPGLQDLFGNDLDDNVFVTFTVEDLPPYSIGGLVPDRGVEGSVVVISGYDFSPDPADMSVTFDGVSATVLGGDAGELVVVVPAGAGSGEVVVSESTRGDTAPATFTVLPSAETARATEIGAAMLGGLPRAVDVMPSGRYAYAATDAGFSSVLVDPADPGFLGVTSQAIADGLEDIVVRPDGARTLGVSYVGQTLSIIDSDDVPGNASFNTVLTTLSVSDRPLGIVVGPRGDRAYIPTAAGEIQVWDVSSDAAAAQVGVIASPDPNLRGRMALDPVRNELLILSGTGKVLFFELEAGAYAAELRVGPDPRGITMDAAAAQAYVTDADGSVTILSLASRFAVTPEITTGGSLRGVAITPAGGFLYTANRQLNVLETIDLDPARSSFRTVVGRIPQGVNPVDVDVSPDGLYLFSLVEESGQLVVTSIGLGPAVSSLSRYAGPEGGYVVFAGDGFGVDSLLYASFNGLEVAPASVDDSTVVTPLPAGATGGPAKIVGISSGGQVVESNEFFFDVLGPTPPGGLRLAAKVAPPGGAPALTTAMSVSPTGNVMVFGGEDGEVWVTDIDPASADYNQVVGTFTPTGGAVDDVVVTPDGQRALVLSSLADDLVAVDVNPLSPSFGNTLGTVDFSSLGSHVNERIALSPDGRRLLVSDPANQWVHVVDTDPASAGAYTLLSSLSVGATTNGDVFEMAFHPAGRYAYLPVQDVDSQTIVIADLWTGTAVEYGLPGTPPTETPVDIVFTPDGNSAYMLTTQTQGIDNRSVLTLSTTVPTAPTLVRTQALGASLGPIAEHISMSPRGDRVIFALRGEGFYHAVATPDSVEVLEVTGDLFFHLLGVEMDYTPDGSRVYATSEQRDSVYVYDFSTAQNLALESGDGQTGVIDMELASPLAVRVTDGGGLPVAGVPVRFDVTGGGGTFIGTGSATQVVASGSDGIARVQLRLGSVIGAGTHTVGAASDGLAGSPVTFSADAVDNPDNLPLEITGLLPRDGSADLSVTTALQATFTRAVDRASVTSSSFRLVRATDGAAVAATVGFASEDEQVSLTPDVPLEQGVSYSLQVGALLDTQGGALLNPDTTTFGTAAAPPPLRLEAIDPPSATAGVTVVLSGQSFAVPFDANAVLFNDVSVTPDMGDVDYLNVTVPVNASSGDVRVVAGPDTSNAITFTVIPLATTSIDEVIATVGTGTGTRGVAVGPDGAIAYTVSPGAGTVVPVDVQAENTYPAIDVGTEPVAIDITPDGTRAFVANLGSGTVSVIDTDPASPTFHQVIETILVGTAPSDLDVSPDGDRLYVVNALSDNLSVIDSDASSVTHLEVLATVGTGSNPRGVSVGPDGLELYIGDEQGYLVVDPISYEVVATVGTGRSTKGVSVGPDGGLLFLLTTEGEVLIVDIEDGSATEDEVVRAIGTGGGTSSFTLSPDGSQLFLVQEESDQILVLDLEVSSSVSIIEDNLPPGRVTVTVSDTLDVGEDPAVLVFDPTDPTRAFLTSPGDQTLIILGTERPPVIADILVEPRTLNVRSNGKWVMGTIELPAAFSPYDIDVSTVMLSQLIPADPERWSIQDTDGDGLEELQVKFNRQAFQSMMPEGDYVPVTITGAILEDTFAGEDTIRTHRPKVKKPTSGQPVTPGSMVSIEWDSPAGVTVDAADVWYSLDDGDSWEVVASGAPDAGTVNWSTPVAFSEHGRVMVTLYDNGKTVGTGMSADPFILTAPVAVSLAAFDLSIENGYAVLQWRTSIELGTDGFNLYRGNSETGPWVRVTPEMVVASGAVEGGAYEFRDRLGEAGQKYYYQLQEVVEGRDAAIFGPFELDYRLVFGLEQNTPNPFNPTTTIRYSLAKRTQVSLAIYDVAGRRVRRLVDGAQGASVYVVRWDGTNDRGQRVASGVYFYRLVAGSFRSTKKMVLLK